MPFIRWGMLSRKTQQRLLIRQAEARWPTTWNGKWVHHQLWLDSAAILGAPLSWRFDHFISCSTAMGIVAITYYHDKDYLTKFCYTSAGLPAVVFPPADGTGTAATMTDNGDQRCAGHPLLNCQASAN